MKKSWIFVFFSKSHGKLIFQGKSPGIVHKPSVLWRICGYGSLLVSIYKLLSVMLSRACIISTLSTILLTGPHTYRK